MKQNDKNVSDVKKKSNLPKENEVFSNNLLLMIEQLRTSFELLGLHFIPFTLQNISKTTNFEHTLKQLQKWNDEFSEFNLSVETDDFPVTRNFMIQLNDKVVVDWALIRNIVCCERYDLQTNEMVYSIVLNYGMQGNNSKIGYVDYEFVFFKTKEERNERYRKIKDKLRFLGIKCV